jgi:hypothetical protein
MIHKTIPHYRIIEIVRRTIGFKADILIDEPQQVITESIVRAVTEPVTNAEQIEHS